jgi:two-component system, chemotaxis family, protein-glutamate methylesterase/glutaminase
MPLKQNERIITEDINDQQKGARAGETSVYSCPECGGVLWQLEHGHAPHFRCHTGHAYAPDTLVVAMTRALEQAVFEAIRGLKEKAILLRQLAAVADPRSPNTIYLIEQADQDDEHARLLQTHLLGADQAHMTSIDATAGVIGDMVREMRRPADD